MYIVKKPLNLRGIRRKIGEIVNEKDIDKTRVYSLVRSGYLSEVGESVAGLIQDSAVTKPLNPAQEGEALINVPIIRKEGTMSILVVPEGISEVIRLLQSTALDAEQAIKDIEDDNILILLDACDSRKTVKAAARNRAMELSQGTEIIENEEEIESEGDA